VHRISIFQSLGRLRPGATVAQATAEANARARTAPDPGIAAVAMFGGKGAPQITVTSALDAMVGDVKEAILILLGAVALLLATATANVASLQLARATTRRREIAIRAALGAGTTRLARQLGVESLIVGIGGGIAGLGLAAGIYRALPSILPANFPRSTDIALNGWVFALAAGLAVLTSLASGLLPVMHARRVNLTESLAEDGQAPIGGGSRSRVARTRTFIMAGQLAISCVLLIGAVLLGRSFLALLNADRGYDPRNLLTARLALPDQYSLARRSDVLDGVIARMRGTPGVVAAGWGNALPFVASGGFRGMRMRPPIDPSTEVDVHAITRVVSPGYFAALGLRVIAGRALSEADTMTSQESVVVNRSFAAKYLGSRSVGVQVPNLGMCRGDDDRWEVVGVVDDMRQGAVGDPPEAEIFMPARQIGCAAAFGNPIIAVRTVDDPLGYTASLRSAVREQAPELALDSVMTMDERVMSSVARPRFYAVLLAAFAIFAVLIAGVGLFGVLSYSVAQRSREIGVRTALGAQPADIVRLVLRQAAAITIGGAAAGMWAAFALVRYLSTFLYGVTTHDVLSFAVVPLVLTVVAAIACVVPARRAARVDPLTALRA
jgi:predicted permease